VSRGGGGPNPGSAPPLSKPQQPPTATAAPLPPRPRRCRSIIYAANFS
ncbi:unnamed protein product, partial [Phaeothamnion confervicola]